MLTPTSMRIEIKGRIDEKEGKKKKNKRSDKIENLAIEAWMIGAGIDIFRHLMVVLAVADSWVKCQDLELLVEAWLGKVAGKHNMGFDSGHFGAQCHVDLVT